MILRGPAILALMLAAQRAEPFSIAAGGTSLPVMGDPVDGAPDWIAQGDQDYARFGQALADAGDVNGDGFDDVIVGAHDFHAPGAMYPDGRAFLYYGSASGPSLAPDWIADGAPNDGWFGWSVAGAGDVNADGFDDLLVGAPLSNGELLGEGRVYLFHGSASGPSTTSDWSGESSQELSRYGWSVGAAGDVNADGFDDVLVGAPRFDNGQFDEGRAYVYFGSATGLPPAAGWRAEPNRI